MNVKIIRASEITAPVTSPLTSSVLDHATVVPNSQFGLRNDEGLWLSYNCIDTLVPTSVCPDPMSVKTFDFAEWVPGLTFAMQGGVQCKAVGLDEKRQLAELERVFALNEGKGVEQVLRFNRFVATDSDASVQWAAPVDLNPTANITPQAALALLEGYAASVYAGVPTIHMPRAVASLLGDRITWEGDKAYTRLGSKVAMGGGYDDPTAPAVGEWEMFATGEVYVERSEEFSISSYVLPGDGSGLGSDENGLADNTVIALAERMYRVGVDCFVAKATGSMPASTGGGFGL